MSHAADGQVLHAERLAFELAAALMAGLVTNRGHRFEELLNG